MVKSLALNLRYIVSNISDYWNNNIKNTFNIKVTPKDCDVEAVIFRQIYLILLKMTAPVINDCGIHELFLKDLGPSKSFYPNHGFFMPGTGTITLNINIFTDPDQPEDFFDPHGFFVSRAVQTLFHEMAHAYDEKNGNLSYKPEWMQLSGWSKEPQPGLKRLLIKEPGTPPVLGEMYFDPHAGFPRFYAKRNNWDDFADCFSFYLAGLYDKLPTNKQEYFKKLFSKYPED
jgi:hypothetical protein